MPRPAATGERGYEGLPVEQRFAAGEAERSGGFVNQRQGSVDLLQDPLIVDITRRLGAHEAVVVASLRDEK